MGEVTIAQTPPFAIRQKKEQMFITCLQSSQMKIAGVLTCLWISQIVSGSQAQGIQELFGADIPAPFS